VKKNNLNKIFNKGLLLTLIFMNNNFNFNFNFNSFIEKHPKLCFWGGLTIASIVSVFSLKQKFAFSLKNKIDKQQNTINQLNETIK